MPKALIRTNRKKKLQAQRDPFVALARAIVSQQISVKAAATAWQRLVDATGSIEFARISKSEMREIVENWQPWCTVATWFMWRAIDPKP